MPLAPAEKHDEAGNFRVMVVDDSAVIRGLIARWLDADPEITVVSTAHNGVMALRNLLPSRAEVVVLDIEMPEMDGLTALPKIIAAAPHVQVIMASTLTRRNAEISLRALAEGAADYVPKPETNREVNTSLDFRRDITAKVKALGAVARELQQSGAPKRAARPVAAAAPLTTSPVGAPLAPALARPALPPLGRPTLQRASAVLPRILAIGSSTGGPQALFALLNGLEPGLKLPVLIAQHMPPTFTAILADHLARATGLACREARDGEPLEARTVYVAPGDHHMVVAAHPGGALLRLTKEPAENFCRPSVDPLLRSVAELYGAASLAVILTGMGNDGLGGARSVVAAGGTVIAQDQATSVVWGMPGAVVGAGLASAILPLAEIAPAIDKLSNGVRR